MEPYDPIPGRVPRKVAIERKKKEYASFDINELLHDNRIDFLSKNKETWLLL
jgi:dynein heavy chain